MEIQTGIITSFEKKSFTPDTQVNGINLDVRDREIEVTLSDDEQVHIQYTENSKEYLPVVKTKDGRIFTVARKTFTEYKIEKVVKGHPYEPVIKGEVTQIGCRVAYASTVHKAQGLTLNAVYFDPTKKPMPNSVYVALSRLKSLDGLGLKRKLTADDIIITDESVELYKEFNAMEPD